MSKNTTPAKDAQVTWTKPASYIWTVYSPGPSVCGVKLVLDGKTTLAWAKTSDLVVVK